MTQLQLLQIAHQTENIIPFHFGNDSGYVTRVDGVMSYYFLKTDQSYDKYHIDGSSDAFPCYDYVAKHYFLKNKIFESSLNFVGWERGGAIALNLALLYATIGVKCHVITIDAPWLSIDEKIKHNNITHTAYYTKDYYGKKFNFCHNKLKWNE